VDTEKTLKNKSYKTTQTKTTQKNGPSAHFGRSVRFAKEHRLFNNSATTTTLTKCCLPDEALRPQEIEQKTETLADILQITETSDMLD
jgi:hypothetical protein